MWSSWASESLAEGESLSKLPVPFVRKSPKADLRTDREDALRHCYFSMLKVQYEVLLSVLRPAILVPYLLDNKNSTFNDYPSSEMAYLNDTLWVRYGEKIRKLRY